MADEYEAAELEALKSFLVAHEGQFALAFVRVNDPVECRRLVQKLVSEGVGLSIVDCSNHVVASLLDELRRFAAERPGAVALLGLERSIVDVAEGEPRSWAQRLNQERDAFRELFHFPITVWLTDYATDMLTADAPDFADWHSAVFRFGRTPALALPEYDRGEMDSEQRLGRIELLEQRRHGLLKEGKPNKRRLANVHLELGALYGSQRINASRQAAIGHLLESARIFEALGDQHGEAAAHWALGDVYGWLEDKAKSFEHHSRAYELSLKSGNEQYAASAALGLGKALRSSEASRSDEFLKEAAGRFRTLGRRADQADALRLLGENAFAKGDFEEALRYYAKAQDLYREVRDNIGQGNILHNRASIHTERQEWKRAQRLLEEAGAKFQAGNSRIGMANALMKLGITYIGQKRWEKSIESATNALLEFRELGLRVSEAGALRVLAAAYLGLMQKDRVREALEKASSLYADAKDEKMVAETKDLLAKLNG